MLGETSLLSLEAWPAYEESKTVEQSIRIAVQVNGKMKNTIELPMDCEEEPAIAAALADEKVAKAVEGMQIVKKIYRKNKIINLVVKP